MWPTVLKYKSQYEASPNGSDKHAAGKTSTQVATEISDIRVPDTFSGNLQHGRARTLTFILVPRSFSRAVLVCVRQGLHATCSTELQNSVRADGMHAADRTITAARPGVRW